MQKHFSWMHTVSSFWVFTRV